MNETLILDFTEKHGINVLTMKKRRAKNSENGGIYYGGTFFNCGEIENNAPDYLLMKNCVTKLSFRDSNCMTHAYVVTENNLKKITKTQNRYFIDWGFFRVLPINDKYRFVYMANFCPKLNGNLVSRVYIDGICN